MTPGRPGTPALHGKQGLSARYCAGDVGVAVFYGSPQGVYPRSEGAIEAAGFGPGGPDREEDKIARDRLMSSLLSDSSSGRAHRERAMRNRGARSLVLGTALLVSVAVIGAPSASAAKKSVCVAANDDVRHQSGSASCEAFGTGSIALAVGEDSTATATGGNRNKARVIGDDSSAEAGTLLGRGEGDGNTAFVRGDDSDAFAGRGDNNTATVNGDGSTASAPAGDNNTATVNGDGSNAGAGVGGDNNTATVNGDGSNAGATLGDNNTATVNGDGSTADAFDGDNNTATVNGDGSTAEALHGDDNTATATSDGCTAVALGSGATDSC